MSRPTLDGLRLWGAKRLAEAGIETAALDARVLLAHAAEVSTEFLLTRGDAAAAENTAKIYGELIEKRRHNAPVAYLTGHCEFMGLGFIVNERVLIPRADTEILVEAAIALIKNYATPKILDLCCGSGCVGVSLARYTDAFVVCADIDPPALEIARGNAERNGVVGKMGFALSDMFGKIDGKFDLIVSNPPYIAREDMNGLPPSVRDYEPWLALDGGDGGLEFYRRIFGGAGEFLRANGVVLAEIAYDQGEAAESIAGKNGFRDIRIIRDLAGKDRVCQSQYII